MRILHSSARVWLRARLKKATRMLQSSANPRWSLDQGHQVAPWPSYEFEFRYQTCSHKFALKVNAQTAQRAFAYPGMYLKQATTYTIRKPKVG